jgi:hypothetical protein
MRQEGHEQNRDRTPSCFRFPRGAASVLPFRVLISPASARRMRYYLLLWAARRMRYSITASISSVEALTA